MAKAIERGRLKEAPAREVTDIMVAPTLTQEEIERSFQIYVDVNKAHVLMLAKQGIITRGVAKKILEVADEMAKMGTNPTFETLRNWRKCISTWKITSSKKWAWKLEDNNTPLDPETTFTQRLIVWSRETVSLIFAIKSTNYVEH